MGFDGLCGSDAVTIWSDHFEIKYSHAFATKEIVDVWRFGRVLAIIFLLDAFEFNGNFSLLHNSKELLTAQRLCSYEHYCVHTIMDAVSRTRLC